MANEPLSPLAEDVVIPVDRLTFMVPSRRFHVEGTLLKGGYVSVATEFALRLLRDVGELPPGELGAFLGFSDLEARTLVQELLLDGYVEVSGERVRLSNKGEASFDPVTGELRLLDVEPFADNIALDMLSFAPIDMAGTARLPWLPEIDISDRARAAAARDAGQKGFRENFGEWRDRKFRGEGGPPIRLHTLDDPVPLARATTPVTIDVSYAPAQGDGVEPDFSALRDRGRRGARVELVDALNDAVRRLVAPGDHVAAAELASSWDGGVFKGPGGNSVANALAWMQLARRSPAGLPSVLAPSVRLSGSMTATGVLPTLSGFLDGVAQVADLEAPVVWVPAEHAAWGASAALLDVARLLKSGLAPKAGIFFMPRADLDDRTRRQLSDAYGGGRNFRAPLFDNCVTLPVPALPLSLELLVQPGAWAIVLVHVPETRGGFPIPIGYATRNPAVVATISGMLGGIVAGLPEAAVQWAERHATAVATLEYLEGHLGGGAS